MPFYMRAGNIPHKRHTRFHKSDDSLYHEEVMGMRGFAGIQSILYRLHAPTAIRSSEVVRTDNVEYSSNESLAPVHLAAKTFNSPGDAVSGRTWLLGNSDVRVGISTPDKEMDFFYRNGVCDEMYFVHHGSGTVKTQFGDLAFRGGDYIVLPVGTTFQINCSESCRFLVLESEGRIEFPKRYRNEYGQLLEHSPFCERDIRLPEIQEPIDKDGSYTLQVKIGTNVSAIERATHPFDVVGWDGYLYPWIFNIEDFEPITGSIHQPPPVHQTFEAPGYVICSFVPRMYDYHPEAIAVPYNHSNVNSGEVLYYVEGEFMSRKGIDSGSFTLHPAGIPHGPHPGTIEKGFGKTRTEELAVMVDTFAPLRVTRDAEALVDKEYLSSWL